MHRTRTLFFVFAVVLTLFFAVSSSKAQELVENGGFETGDLTGWTQQTFNGAGSWSIYSVVGPPDYPPPPQGTYSVVTSQSDPDSNILYQDIELPDNANISCSVIVYYMNRFVEIPPPTDLGFTASGASDISTKEFIDGSGLSIQNGPNQQYRIDIMNPDAPAYDTGEGVLMNIFQTKPGDPDELGYTTLNFDLTPYAGTTVRFRAAVVVTEAQLHGSIDDLSCVAEAINEVPTLSEWGLIAMAGVLGIVGFMAARRRKTTA